jgi:hypothetical protein
MRDGASSAQSVIWFENSILKGVLIQCRTLNRCVLEVDGVIDEVAE